MTDITTPTGLSETAASNTNVDGANVAENCAPSNLNNGIRGLAALLAMGYNRLTGKYASTGSANAYVLTPDTDLAAYVTGERYSFRANFANTGSASLNISSLGAKTIKKVGSSGKTNLVSGDIQDGQPVTVEYDGTDMVMVTPTAGLSTNAGTVTSVATAGLATGGPITSTGTVTVTKATQANMEAETADKVATADTLKYHPGVAKVSIGFHWDSVNSVIVLDEGYGVDAAADITRNGTGDYTITFNVTFASTKFRVAGSFDLTSDNAPIGFSIKARTTTSVRIQLGWGGTFAAGDPSFVSLMVFGDLA